MTVVDRPLDVLIVGAGIAGLSAAIALGKQGHRAVVSSWNRDIPQVQNLTQLRRDLDFGKVGIP